MKSLILPPFDNLYALVIRTRNALYERGTFTTTNLERPVISVGNITTGGTGKTPLVEWIARTVAEDGKKVCILTRGYGRNDPKRRVLVSDGETLFSNPAEAGDEPYLLARNLRGLAAVISDPNRIGAAQG
ncbi:MAG: tetraacyldisaccharide 4'-kinase, partial [Acidobacteria bacterium]